MYLVLVVIYTLQTVYLYMEGHYQDWIANEYTRTELEMSAWTFFDVMVLSIILLVHNKNFGHKKNHAEFAETERENINNDSSLNDDGEDSSDFENRADIQARLTKLSQVDVTEVVDGDGEGYRESLIGQRDSIWMN